MSKQGQYDRPAKRDTSGIRAGTALRRTDRWGLTRLKENLSDPADFRENGDYTSYELELFADAILWKSFEAHSHQLAPRVLMKEHLHRRRMREIYVESGFPDKTLTNALSADGQMLYWRTHPRGRKRGTHATSGFYR